MNRFGMSKFSFGEAILKRGAPTLRAAEARRRELPRVNLGADTCMMSL